MCLLPAAIPPVPEETARVAHAAFPKGHPYLLMRDQFGALFEDVQFDTLFPFCGQPALAPWRLALMTILQYVEGLSDRQTADAVRRCLDWKYLLGLELTDPGFDASVLSEFRSRLLAGSVDSLHLIPCWSNFEIVNSSKLGAANGRIPPTSWRQFGR
jgi:transposase